MEKEGGETNSAKTKTGWPAQRGIWEGCSMTPTITCLKNGITLFKSECTARINNNFPFCDGCQRKEPMRPVFKKKEYELSCKKCGESFTAAAKTAFYCPECRILKRAEWASKYYANLPQEKKAKMAQKAKVIIKKQLEVKCGVIVPARESRCKEYFECPEYRTCIDLTDANNWMGWRVMR